MSRATGTDMYSRADVVLNFYSPIGTRIFHLLAGLGFRQLAFLSSPAFSRTAPPRFCRARFSCPLSFSPRLADFRASEAWRICS